MAVADRLRATATEPLTVGGRSRVVHLTVSVAFTPGDAAAQAAALLREAGRSRT